MYRPLTHHRAHAQRWLCSVLILEFLKQSWRANIYKVMWAHRVQQSTVLVEWHLDCVTYMSFFLFFLLSNLLTLYLFLPGISLHCSKWNWKFYSQWCKKIEIFYFDVGLHVVLCFLYLQSVVWFDLRQCQCISCYLPSSPEKDCGLLCLSVVVWGQVISL